MSLTGVRTLRDGIYEQREAGNVARAGRLNFLSPAVTESETFVASLNSGGIFAQMALSTDEILLNAGYTREDKVQTEYLASPTSHTSRYNRTLRYKKASGSWIHYEVVIVTQSHNHSPQGSSSPYAEAVLAKTERVEYVETTP